MILSMITSALSVILEDFVRLASLTEELDYNEIVKETIKESGAVLQNSPAKAPKLVYVFYVLKWVMSLLNQSFKI